jgi:tetratricopeptide (TPR) repeat protein
MGILPTLFGDKKPAEPAKLPSQPAATAEELRSDPNLIRVFDKYGRELFVSKDEWRKNILPGALRERWAKPDELYQTIVAALNDGFRSDVVAAAQRLYEIDPVRGRSACLWGIVLMEENRLDDAERVLRQHVEHHGEDGYVLTNLAKVHAKRGDNARAEAVLWRALEVDPNQENALNWYSSLQAERGGDAARQAALERVAAQRGSWRAQLWLARTALARKDVAEALRLYRECLARNSHPVPGDVLMQISGDLSNAGYLEEALAVVTPEFDAQVHGLLVGNNLIKANVDLRRLGDARRILDALYAQRRPDWRTHLSFWDTEIAKVRLEQERAATPANLALAVLVADGPVWLRPDSPAAHLFPPKASTSTIVAFLGNSAELATKPERPTPQLADAPGRISRALPLFFAEQIELATDARTRTLIPWVESGGFALFGTPLSDEDALTYSRDPAQSDYLVVSHIEAKSDDWNVTARVLRTSDGERLAELHETFAATAPTESIQRMARQLRELFVRIGAARSQPLPDKYAVPQAEYFPEYLLRLEQLLAVRCTPTGSTDGFLSGERDIVAGFIDLCLRTPESVSSRLLLAQLLLAMAHTRPNVVQEFADNVTALQQEHPLSKPAHECVQGIFAEATKLSRGKSAPTSPAATS